MSHSNQSTSYKKIVRDFDSTTEEEQIIHAGVFDKINTQCLADKKPIITLKHYKKIVRTYKWFRHPIMITTKKETIYGLRNNITIQYEPYMAPTDDFIFIPNGLEIPTCCFEKCDFCNGVDKKYYYDHQTKQYVEAIYIFYSLMVIIFYL